MMSAELPLIPLPRHLRHTEAVLWAQAETPVELRHLAGLDKEEYHLDLDGSTIRIAAATMEGRLRGLATLCQLMPPDAMAACPKVAALDIHESKKQLLALGSVLGFFRPHRARGLWKPAPGTEPAPWEGLASPIHEAPERSAPAQGLWKVGAVTIQDSPLHPWRGLMLDCARHFFSVDWVCRVLDIMAACKLNVFHWHLSDDQGFRLDLPSLPRLSEVGSRRGSGPDRHEGCYGTADVARVLAYARDRGITVVPEIDMPGHAGAMLASYPFLGCTGKPMEVPQQWGVLAHFLCPGKDSTLTFVDSLLADLAALFPGSPVHLGGDEVRDLSVWDNCPHCAARRREKGLSDSRALEGWFMKEVIGLASARGLEVTVWDDCASHFGQADRSSPRIQVWHHAAQAREAATRGHRLIASNADRCYLDMFYHPPMPKYWIAPLSSRDAWDFDPQALFPQGLLGIEAALWTEYCPTAADAEWKLLPRLLVMAEKAWHGQGDWDHYRRRMQHLEAWFLANGLRHYREPCLFDPLPD